MIGKRRSPILVLRHQSSSGHIAKGMACKGLVASVLRLVVGLFATMEKYSLKKTMNADETLGWALATQSAFIAYCFTSSIQALIHIIQHPAVKGYGGVGWG